MRIAANNPFTASTFPSSPTRFLLARLVLLSGLALSCSARLLAADGPSLAQWTLREQLGHSWRHELVFYPLPADAKGDGSYQVVDEKGTAFPAQVEIRGNRAFAGFFVDLPPNQTRTFRLLRGAAPGANPDLVVTEEKEAWTLGSKRCAVRIPPSRGIQAG